MLENKFSLLFVSKSSSFDLTLAIMIYNKKGSKYIISITRSESLTQKMFFRFSSDRRISKLGISRPLLSRSCMTRVWPMRAPNITKLSSRSFQHKFKRESRGLEIPIFKYVVRIMWTRLNLWWYQSCHRMNKNKYFPDIF